MCLTRYREATRAFEHGDLKFINGNYSELTEAKGEINCQLHVRGKKWILLTRHLQSYFTLTTLFCKNIRRLLIGISEKFG